MLRYDQVFSYDFISEELVFLAVGKSHEILRSAHVPGSKTSFAEGV